MELLEKLLKKFLAELSDTREETLGRIHYEIFRKEILKSTPEVVSIGLPKVILDVIKEETLKDFPE